MDESASAKLQRMSNEIRRLQKIVDQQKYTLNDNLQKYLKCKDDLRDAEAHILVLEGECEMWKQEYYDVLRRDTEGG